MLDESSPLIAGLTLLVSRLKSVLMIEAASMHQFNTLPPASSFHPSLAVPPPSPGTFYELERQQLMGEDIKHTLEQIKPAQTQRVNDCPCSLPVLETFPLALQIPVPHSRAVRGHRAVRLIKEKRATVPHPEMTCF